MPSLELFVHDRLVGVVEPVSRDRSRVALEVDANFDNDGVLLSESFATLPGRRPPVAAVSNFLGGYVPEGNHREQMAAKRHIDPGDLFALLREFGGSIAGAVSLRSADEALSYQPSYQPLSERMLEVRLKQALKDSDQGIPDDSRSTLPGYQPKVLVAEFDGTWAYPHSRAHSTYILKPQVASRPSRLFDEFYSHELTRRIGLSRYHSEIRTAGTTKYLAIERFDRTVEAGEVHLLHQEDLAQAMDLDWRNTDVKFQDATWPADPKRATLRRIAELLGSIPGGDAAVDQWIRQLTYAVSIGDNDAHAKNVALMHLESGTELAQVYDALPNLFQDGLVKWDLALAVNGVFDHRRLSVEVILAEVASWGLVAGRRAETIVDETLSTLADAVSAIEPPKGASPGMVTHVQWNVTRLRAGAEISESKRRL
ncbi:type II toxin-antitoxin system HipA family toxin [Subtercola lobariae]|uniref:Type II toxin-antitoxin system HipA family toxin n=1 Tax=Subtercola lobariae TaxID=1588641 RepID=A0A917B1I4_9MICO|nr:HipA domain-containing protein [Subtercola lobariae]GGF11893.1 hypothetical protein GCM10011399_02230 [Subtercola lobariae]